MKNFKFILLVFILSSTIGFSQTTEGRYYFGAKSSLNFSSLKGSYESNNYNSSSENILNLNLSPQAGYFFKDQLVFGLELPINFFNIGEKNYESNKSFSFIVAPFVKYYFLSEKIKPFIQLQYGLGEHYHYNVSRYSVSPTSNFDVFQSTDTVITKLNRFMGTLGFSYFINSNIGIELNINYTNNKEEYNDNNLGYDDYSTTVKGVTSSIGFVILV